MADESEKNIEEALTLAKNIFAVIKNPEFVKNYDADTRHQVVIKKYPNFASAYPIILKYLARDLKYNEKAFRRFLNKIKVDPGKGMEGFIERQADYAKFLYIEDCKAIRQHWSMKIASSIWSTEYNHMYKMLKKMKKDEKEAKNEFEEEEKKNLEVKKQELLDFINSSDDLDFEYDIDSNLEDDDFIRETLQLPPKTLADIDPELLNNDELFQFVRQLKDYRLSLVEEIEDAFREAIRLKSDPDFESELRSLIPDPRLILEMDQDFPVFTQPSDDRSQQILYIGEIKEKLVILEKSSARLKSIIEYSQETKKEEVPVKEKHENNEWLIGTSAERSKKKKRIKKIVMKK